MRNRRLVETRFVPFSAAGLDRLGSPSMQERQKRIVVGTLLLQRLSRQAGDKAGHQPGLETQFNHRNQRAILLKGDEGSAQVVHRLS
jgi:hypothetical protein